MKHHRSRRRKKLAKIADDYGLLIFKISLVALAIVLAGLMTYFLSTYRGHF